MTSEYALRERLNEWPLPETETAWGKRRQEIRDRMKRDDWSDFLRWSVVRASLFTGRIQNTDAEVREIEGSSWHRTLNKLGMIPENGTAIHQAHLMWWFENWADYPIFLDDTISEFGGGYGEMYRVLYEWGYRGDYYVYDFPELLTLQEYYLSSNGIPLDNWHPCYLPGEFALVKDVELFVSVCALSEAPLNDRWVVGEQNPKNLAIRYQPMWDGIDNAGYFLSYAKAHKKSHLVNAAPGYMNHSLIAIFGDNDDY